MSSYGEPKDVVGECNAHLYIADNFGDNHATMRCQLEPHHEGLHEERFHRGVMGGMGVIPEGSGEVIIQWDEDEREKND